MGTDRREPGDVIAAVHARGIAEPDEAAHLDGLMLAALTKANYQVSQYVLRFWDVEAGHAKPIPVADELALASCLSAAVDALRARAKRREAETAPDERPGDGS